MSNAKPETKKNSKQVKEVEELTVDDFRKIKDAYLSMEQGKALRRLSTPSDDAESESLGNFGPMTNFAGELAILFEDLVDDLCQIPKYDSDGNRIDRPDTRKPIKRMIMGLFRASGSKSGMRMEITGKTIGELGQFNPFPEFKRPTPQDTDFNQGRRKD